MQDYRRRTTESIRAFLSRHQWLSRVDRVTFLAAGEYHENYRVRSGSADYVFRINHGTQLGLDDQISYEFAVLEAVAPSGRTPRPYRVCAADDAFPRGAMLMEFIPGGPMDYERDSGEAAELFADIHRLQPAAGLLRQEHPIADIVTESLGLLDRHTDHPMPALGARLREYAGEVAALGRRVDPELHNEKPCMVNTEVNSGNFIRGPDGLRLVDWEKAVVSSRYQDLGHFLVPTTTLWKSEFRFDEARRSAFLRRYHAAAGGPVPFEVLCERTEALERTIVLRALSWCYMAFAEYTRQERTLRNADTFATVESYLRHAREFMEHAGSA